MIGLSADITEMFCQLGFVYGIFSAGETREAKTGCSRGLTGFCISFLGVRKLYSRYE